MAKAVRGAVADADSKQPVFMSTSMSDLIDDSIAERRFIMTLLAVTGMLALMLAAAGIYGVISYTTSRRTQEIGVRIALGAAPSRVVRLVFRQGMLLVSMGAGLGLATALTLIRVLRNEIAALSGMHPGLIALAVAIVIVAAAVACWIPARRATRVDPMLALRQE
jgi:ABC-type antimicrobial peptide transport system permease subunit